MTASPIEITGAVLFAIALIHTFSTRIFERLAHTQPRHAGLWHLLGEIEVVFGFWAFILVLLMFMLKGADAATQYIDSRNFTEPLFVFAIMVIAGTRPILQAATALVQAASALLPLKTPLAHYLVVMALVPLLGSFITEPAAMTLAALILHERYFKAGLSTRLKYATLGVLFVNVSIGGTLTSFAAPPVLMVAAKWNWDTAFMLHHFGWKAAIAVGVNAFGLTWWFRNELMQLNFNSAPVAPRVPLALTATHIVFLMAVVVFAHHPALFMGLFLLFLGVVQAYERHQSPLILREGLLVAFFLAGLVVLGGQQQWWLQPLLLAMNSDAVFVGATLLTAITDNAALTYLGSLVEGLSSDFQYALVAGAVTGGGLTIIANAPNPAGLSILKGHFDDETLNPFGLFCAALLPTLVAVLAFKLL